MPFFNPSEPKQGTDYSKFKTVTVVANFNRDGKIMPVYVTTTDMYDNPVRIQIDGVKYTKDKAGSISYICLYTVGRSQRELMLTFYIADHVWVLDR